LITINRRVIVLMAMFVGFGLLGLSLLSGSSDVDLFATPNIAYGEVICEQCGMIISDEAHAAAYRLPDGQLRIFDDLGDMVLYHQRKGEDVILFWVHDYQTGEWMHARDAYYVATSDLVTPMGHGIAAFTHHADAENFARQHGAPIYRWDDLLAGSPADSERHTG